MANTWSNSDLAKEREGGLRGFLGHFRLAGKKQKAVVEMLLAHLKLAAEAAAELEPLLDRAHQGDWGGVREASKRISELETRADGIHREAVLSISRGAFFSGTREDFLRLMEANDQIVDSIKDASRILAESPLPSEAAKLLFGEPGLSAPDMATRIKVAVASLSKAIDALQTDSKIAVDQAIAVEMAEEEADDLKEGLLSSISSKREELSALVIMQLREFVLTLDNVADAAEDASDLVVELVAKAEA